MATDLSSLPLPELEVLMGNIQERLSRASAALRAKHKGGEWDEYRAAYAEQLTVERAIARAKGEEYAEMFDFPVRWCTGAPLPHLVVDDCKAFLTFLVNVPDPKWDGSYVTIKDPKNGKSNRWRWLSSSDVCLPNSGHRTMRSSAVIIFQAVAWKDIQPRSFAIRGG